MVTLGGDSHKQTHTLVAVDDNGRQLAQKTSPATKTGHLEVLQWARRWPERRWALEDCRHVSRRFEADLLVAGEVVDTAKTLFVVADPRRVWLTLNVRLEDANHLALNQPVHFQPDGGAKEVAGRLGWISTAVDEKTRTVKVRADLENPEGQLRANTFGAGRIILREEKNAVVIPKEALQSDGDCPLVFVRDKNYDPQNPESLLVFHVRKVRSGAQNDGFVEILAGLLPGESVATKGSAVLRMQLRKDNVNTSARTSGLGLVSRLTLRRPMTPRIGSPRNSSTSSGVLRVLSM